MLTVNSRQKLTDNSRQKLTGNSRQKLTGNSRQKLTDNSRQKLTHKRIESHITEPQSFRVLESQSFGRSYRWGRECRVKHQGLRDFEFAQWPLMAKSQIFGPRVALQIYRNENQSTARI